MKVALVGAELEENMAVRYLRAALEAEGHAVTQIDFDRPSDIDRAAAEIVESKACFVGLSMVFTRRADEFARLAARAKELGYPGLIVAGGHFAAFHAAEVLRDVPAIDLVAVGEGERILCAMAKNPTALDTVPNLVWREGDEIRRSPHILPEQDLDTLPWPTRKRPFDAYLGLPIVNMIGSRGCTHACAFCSIAAWHDMNGGAPYRTRSADDVAAEMAALYREGVRLFNFHDDNFLGRDRNANLARARALDEAWARAGIGKIGFQIKARPDGVDEELFTELRAMGLFRVFLGIEAGTELSLKRLGRGQKLADNVRALELLNGLDVHTAFNLLLLNPDSTLEDFAGNVAFLRAHLDNPMNFCRTEIYEGTPLAKKLRTQKRLRGDYWGLDYVIADPQAQLAFEMMSAAFWDRNFGEHPLHYLSGQVDYEHQIRADFFGTNARLRALAKGYVRRVNESTVSMLEDVVEAARKNLEPEPFARDLCARVAADDERLRREGLAALQQIRAIPERVRATRTRSHAAIFAVAALALACQRNETQHMEAAPPPPPTTSGAPPPTATGTELAVPPDAGAPLEPDNTHMAEMAAPWRPPPTAVDAGAKHHPAKKDAGAKTVPTATAVPVHTATQMMEAAPAWRNNMPPKKGNSGP
jgi:anaerobic magnesium-protoporphyrin IX monomethyl ester cyclase